MLVKEEFSLRSAAVTELWLRCLGETVMSVSPRHVVKNGSGLFLDVVHGV